MPLHSAQAAVRTIFADFLGLFGNGERLGGVENGRQKRFKGGLKLGGVVCIGIDGHGILARTHLQIRRIVLVQAVQIIDGRGCRFAVHALVGQCIERNLEGIMLVLAVAAEHGRHIGQSLCCAARLIVHNAMDFSALAVGYVLNFVHAIDKSFYQNRDLPTVWQVYVNR